MKILIVCSGNSGRISPYISDQKEALEKLGINIKIFLIKGKGLIGYLRNLPKLKNYIKDYCPDLIHAHYGLSGLLATFQHIKPVIITLHGSDINSSMPRFFSKIALHRASRVIFVSKKMADKIKINNPIIIPCGINLDIFYPDGKKQSLRKMGLNPEKEYVLFSSHFNNKVKNVSLAFKSINYLREYKNNIEFLELKNYKRNEVAILMNAVDVALLTSFSEGSPQFIKEAMACNCPIVTTDVGDVRWILGNTEGCYITNYKPENVAKAIQKALCYRKRTTGRERIKQLELDSESVANKIIAVYNEVLAS